MSSTRFGGILGKYLVLLLAIAALIGYFVWKESYGKIGGIQPWPSSTVDHVAYLRDVNGQTNLFISDAEGKDVRQRTNDGTAKRTPAWAPDGKQLCYSAEPKNPGPEGRAFQLFLIGA